MRSRSPVATTTAAPMAQLAISAAAASDPTFSNSQTRIAPSVPMVTRGVASMRLSSTRLRPPMPEFTAILPPNSHLRGGSDWLNS